MDSTGAKRKYLRNSWSTYTLSMAKQPPKPKIKKTPTLEESISKLNDQLVIAKSEKDVEAIKILNKMIVRMEILKKDRK